MRISLGNIACVVAVLLMMSGCSFQKYLPENELLLSKVKVKSDLKDVTSAKIEDYVQQKPNSYFLGMGRLQLALYSMSGTDTAKWSNRWLRRIGEEPVIYSEESTVQSQEEISKMLFNHGYMNTSVDVTKKINPKKRSIRLTYDVKAEGKPYTIKSFKVVLPDSLAMTREYAREKRAKSLEGENFNVDMLEEERTKVTKSMRNYGYYNFHKELLYYVIDSTAGDREMNVELRMQPQYVENDSALNIIFERKFISKVTVIALKDGRLTRLEDPNADMDTIYKDGYEFIYERTEKIFRPGAIISKVYIKPNGRYNERLVEKTYAQLNGLSAVKYVNISFREKDDNTLDVFVIVTNSKPHSVSLQLEGTYSGGDLGIKLGAGYTNNNIFKGSETLNVNVAGGYEAMGKLTQVHYSNEIGGDVTLDFPTLLVPFTTASFRRNAIGSTEIGASVNFQQRPEYKRNIANAGYKYNWRWKKVQFTYNLIDISYIYLPWISPDFSDKYLTPSSSIRFSYENQFIMRMGLGIVYTNTPSMLGAGTTGNKEYYTLRANIRTAGNLLYGISNMVCQKKNEDGFYEIFNTQYSQYVKGDVDFSYNIPTSERSSLVFHAGLGVALPYGNATILPFEERYYSGGANSVRGWSVRTLGPGSFRNTEGYIDFMRQSGDIKLDLNIEGRFKLFWKLEGALFLDAGNIWTIKEYDEQPGGYFRFNEFYKQIGCSYGAGLRLDFSFFVIRLDMGIKLYDPSYAKSSDRWRTELTWRNDVAFHFAVGYPF